MANKTPPLIAPSVVEDASGRGIADFWMDVPFNKCPFDDGDDKELWKTSWVDEAKLYIGWEYP